MSMVSFKRLRQSMGLILGSPRNGVKYDYDVIVIGGGSAGLSFAREAGRLGASVALCDYVRPSPQGNKWGLGGTCTNVGCIPKKMMHTAALFRQNMLAAKTLGWKVDPDKIQHDWKEAISNIQDYIKSLNWGFRVILENANVKYFNKHAVFVDPHTVALIDPGTKQSVEKTAKYIVVATGQRPTYLACEGGKREDNLVITSDDIFFMKESPGKTLCIGGSYIALECASFLKHLGVQVDVMVRSTVLRKQDQQMAGMLKTALEEQGINFFMGYNIVSIRKIPGKGNQQLIEVKASDGTKTQVLQYNTVLVAIGREANTKDLNLGAADVKTSDSSHRIIVNKYDQTNVDSIYALGDVAEDRPCLTPPAIKAGRLLAERLFGKSYSTLDYSMTPTTVFTIPEYSYCGMSEEEAIAKFGQDKIEVYHGMFTPYEQVLTNANENVQAYGKLVCSKSWGNKVLGFHYLGPNAGEICQGYAVAMKAGLSKSELDSCIGIHPTSAENFTILSKTKSSGASPNQGPC